MEYLPRLERPRMKVLGELLVLILAPAAVYVALVTLHILING